MCLQPCAERLRRLELYGVDPSHPSEEPRRREASTLVFHMADVETCDASYAAPSLPPRPQQTHAPHVALPQRGPDLLRDTRDIQGARRRSCLDQWGRRLTHSPPQTRAAEVFITHLRPGPRAMFARAGVLALLPPGAVQADVAGAMAMVGMTVER